MTSARRVTAAIFDLDGTLVHSAPDLAAALNVLLAELDLRTHSTAEVTRMIGDGVAVLIECGLRASGVGERELRDLILEYRLVDRFLEIYDGMLTERTTVYDGVIAGIERLQGAGLKLGVCTNKNRDPSLRILEKLDLGLYFDAVTGGDTLAVKKPNAAPLLRTIQDLSATPEQSVMVGDSGNDSLCAAAAGVECILVRYGYSRAPVDQLPAGARVDFFSEIADLILDR